MRVLQCSGRLLRHAAWLALVAVPLGAQTPGRVPLGEVRHVQGQVRHPGRDGTPVPLPRQLVVLHRVGQDRAGPLDSVRTDASGTYRFRYQTTGAPDAVYFASSMYAGIAYFTSPFQSGDVQGADADIMVFDTTSTGIALTLEGRHLVIGAPQANGVREVAEVFDLGNDSTRTLIARDSLSPLWTTALPPDAMSPAVEGGDVAAGAVSFSGGRVNLFAPVSPGVRQLAVAYGLPAKAFPLSIGMDRPVSVLEVLLEEPSATPVLDGLKQQASVNTQGRNFKRYLAQNVPAGAVLRVDVSAVSSSSRTRFLAGMALAMALLMLGALTIALRRRRGAAPPPPAPVVAPAVAPATAGPRPDTDQLLYELAQLDAAFEREPAPSAERAAAHAAARAALKARIADALAAEPSAP